MDTQTMKQTTNTLSDRQRRWRAPLVTSVIHLLMFESVSGFLLFFFGPFMGNTTTLGAVHWWVGVGFLAPYSLYQLRHYWRVRTHTGKFHFNLGLSSFVLMDIVIVTGVLMWLAESRLTNYYGWVDLAHVVIGFALLIMLSTHLVLVFRVGNREETEIGAPVVRQHIWMRILWVPLAISTIASIGWWLFS
jgi:hypothetical protein